MPQNIEALRQIIEKESSPRDALYARALREVFHDETKLLARADLKREEWDREVQDYESIALSHEGQELLRHAKRKRSEWIQRHRVLSRSVEELRQKVLHSWESK